MAIAMQPLTYQEFCLCTQTAVLRFNAQWLNYDQDAAVGAPPFPPVFIVAGPGTGKTTVLSLRVLKHMLVDGFPPESIMATTFTRKAASELRSRILSWGVAIYQEALSRAQQVGNQSRENWLLSLDINRVQTGTLDALCEQMIADDRQPSEITPAVIEGFMARGLLRRNVMYLNRRHANSVLEQHLNSFNPNFPGVRGIAEKTKVSHSFASRVLHDAIDLNGYATTSPGYQMLAELVQDYHNYLNASLLMDFALLEHEILQRLQSGRLTNVTQKLKALLVDEFQDTNYLQEQIYYELCRLSQAGLTVVGDDDQSIYRFRGATVEIFSDFENRIASTLGASWKPRRIDLTDNYRSTERIVAFCNHFISAEPDFQGVRAPGKKPSVPAASWAKDPKRNLPVLGMFRHDLPTLTNDLCTFLGGIFRGNGYTIPGTGFIIRCELGGDFGDAVLLAWKVKEARENGDLRLPGLMRERMNAMYGVEIFNPRGRDLASIPEVAQCLGLILQCIDPHKRLQKSISYWRRQQTPACLDQWRAQASQFVMANPHPGNLQVFLDDWANHHPGNMSMSTWPSEWPLLELLFTVITWIPFFHERPEGQIYLEAIARAIAEAGQISRYNSAILHGTPYDDTAIKEILREVFEPIAEGEVEVDEEIMPYVPRSTFPIMTIHQAKGLEFPLVIVDVGSDFKSNHPSQRRFRYPVDGDNEHHTEDHVATFSPVGPARLRRTRTQRAFDDIRRLYYVAKSRPHNVLLLTGLTPQIGRPPRVLSVATGDLCSGTRTYQFAPSINWTQNSPENFVALI